MSSNYCVICGTEIPEGWQVCPICDKLEVVRGIESEFTIKIKYHDEEMGKIQKIKVGDFIDLRAAETVKIRKGKYKLISLGVSMQLPKGYYAEVVPRSSTFKNFGVILANSVGIIDESYCGDNDVWKFPAIAMRRTTIHKGDRICQFRIVKKMPAIEFVEVETLGNADRGGVGSTGRN